MTNLERQQVQFGIKSFVQFTGKGRKERAVPLWPTTTRALQSWFKEVELDKRNGASAFPNARGKRLSRDGVNYLLQECVERAVAKCPSLANKRISPHVFRHSTAMHMLQGGVDITVIALWLGHESIQTTSDDPRIYRSRPGHQGAGAPKSRARRAGREAIQG